MLRNLKNVLFPIHDITQATWTWGGCVFIFYKNSFKICWLLPLIYNKLKSLLFLGTPGKNVQNQNTLNVFAFILCSLSDAVYSGKFCIARQCHVCQCIHAHRTCTAVPKYTPIEICSSVRRCPIKSSYVDHVSARATYVMYVVQPSSSWTRWYVWLSCSALLFPI